MNTFGYVSILGLLVIVACVSSLPTGQETNSLEEPLSALDVNRLEEENSYNNYLKEMLRRRMEVMAKVNGLTLKKRTCYINAGMTHNCDFKDLMSAMNARKFWESSNTPGKRRRRSVDSEA